MRNKSIFSTDYILQKNELYPQLIDLMFCTILHNNEIIMQKILPF